MGHKRDQNSSFTICLRFYGLHVTFWIPPMPTPSFILHIGEKASAKGKKFSSQWNRIQEFICLKVRVKLNYVTWGCCQNPGLFSVLNQETTSGNLVSRYLRLKTLARNVNFTKGGCQVCFAFNIAFLTIWILTLNKKAGRRPRARSL